MKIVFIINKLNKFGGSERVVSNLASEISKSHDVSIITQQDIKTVYEVGKNVKLYSTNVESKIPIVRLINREILLRKRIKNLNPDLIISFITDMNILAIIACFGLQKKIIVSERSDPKKTYFLLKFLRFIFYRFASGFVFQSKDSLNYFSKKVRSKAIIIPNPISEFLPRKDNYKLTNNLISVGRLEKQKNFSFMIDNFFLVSKRFPMIKLHIYGDGNEKKNLQDKIYKLGLSSVVYIHSPTKEIHQILKNSDIFILTSSFEGMPNSLAEAMAIGLPCIASNCPAGGVSDLVTSGINGLLYEVNNSSEFINKLCNTIELESERISLGSKASEIKQKYELSKVSLVWLEYFYKILEQ